MSKILSFKTRKEIVVPAGAYFMGSTMIMLLKKPNWFQRTFNKYLLGFIWKDIDPVAYIKKATEVGL